MQGLFLIDLQCDGVPSKEMDAWELTEYTLTEVDAMLSKLIPQLQQLVSGRCKTLSGSPRFLPALEICSVGKVQFDRTVRHVGHGPATVAGAESTPMFSNCEKVSLGWRVAPAQRRCERPAP